MIRILYFYLAVILYNLWILINYKCGSKTSAYMMKLYITLSLFLTYIQYLKYMT